MKGKTAKQQEPKVWDYFSDLSTTAAQEYTLHMQCVYRCIYCLLQEVARLIMSLLAKNKPILLSILRTRNKNPRIPIMQF
jgi:hypothetical protein